MKQVQKETAVLLKEKGFDLDTYDCYVGNEQIIDKTYREYRNHNTSPLRYSSPTLYEATEWLRAKGVHVYALVDNKHNFWYYEIQVKDGVYVEYDAQIHSPTHDLALEAGIIHALKKITHGQ
jgi:hypothetical protein